MVGTKTDTRFALLNKFGAVGGWWALLGWCVNLALGLPGACLAEDLPRDHSGPPAGWSVETVSLDREAMQGFLNHEARRLADEADQRLAAGQGTPEWRAEIAREFRFMIGLDPLPQRTPLALRTARTLDREDYSVEVLCFQSLPGLYVTANLYRPRSGEGPFPAVIWGPGHSADPEGHGAKAIVQEYAVAWVRAGYICLVIDAIQVAEVFAEHRGTHSSDMRDWYSRGYSPIGVEVWNAMRAVDLLGQRPDVDAGKITINGVSGGGHLSWMAGAADERLAVVQPVAGAVDIPAHIEHDLQRMHCDCAYFINCYRHDWPMLMALIQPRPLLIHSSWEDSYYPPDGYRRLVNRGRPLYNLAGAPEKLALFEVAGPHAYTPAQRVRAVEWSNHWLLGKTEPVKERPFDPIPHDQLSFFGGQIPSDAINPLIHERFLPVAAFEPPADRAAWERRRGEILHSLQTIVFRNLPTGRTGLPRQAGDKETFALQTEPGVWIGMAPIWHRPLPPGTKQPALVYVASPGETVDSIAWNFLRVGSFPRVPASMTIVFPRGVGNSLWNDTERRSVERSAMLLGRTLDEMRLHDILCAVEYAATQDDYSGSELTIVGKGASGILGAYAALLDSRVTRVILHSPPLSHRSGPTFLNVLRYVDIPEALAMLAPRELTILTHEIESLDATRSIYRLVDADSRFRRGYTVVQTLYQRP